MDAVLTIHMITHAAEDIPLIENVFSSSIMILKRSTKPQIPVEIVRWYLMTWSGAPVWPCICIHQHPRKTLLLEWNQRSSERLERKWLLIQNWFCFCQFVSINVCVIHIPKNISYWNLVVSASNVVCSSDQIPIIVHIAYLYSIPMCGKNRNKRGNPNNGNPTLLSSLRTLSQENPLIDNYELN